MLTLDWQELNKFRLNQNAKLSVMEAFSSHGFSVSELRSRNAEVDFSVSFGFSPNFDIKVKAVRGWNYIFFVKEKFSLRASLYVVAVLYHYGHELPSLYLIPSLVWEKPNRLFVSRNYVGKKSKPEWGIDLYDKNMPMLKEYAFEKMIQTLK